MFANRLRLVAPGVRRGVFVASALVALTALGGCSTGQTGTTAALGSSPAPATDAGTAPASTTANSDTASTVTRPDSSPAPSPAAPVNVYAHTGLGMMSPAVANAKPLIYVPSNDDGSVTVIDQATMQIIGHYRLGKLIQHVVPSWDLSTLYATVSGSDRLVPFDPATGTPGTGIKVAAPYNLYFTPDGTTAIVMAERLNRMDFYDPTTWKLLHSVSTKPCKGINHADWSPDGKFFLATCEFSGEILKVDTATGEILNRLALPPGSMPQDLRIVADGSKFYVADMMHAELIVISADGTEIIGTIPTGIGTHGIYPSRDAKLMYVTNRGRTAKDTRRRSREGDGSISVVDPTTDSVVATWPIPGGGSPDMGGVSADGTTLWVSGRYDDVVYAFDTATGDLKAKITVPGGPHGLAVFPQPGRYSLGHTGNFR